MGGPQKILGEPRGAPNDTPGRGAPVPGAARAQRPVRHWLSEFLDSRVPFDDVPDTITVGNENAYIIRMHDTNMWRFFYKFENN